MILMLHAQDHWIAGPPGTDLLTLRNIKLTASVGVDCWQRIKPQPVLLSVSLHTDVHVAAETDHVDDTIDYGKVYRHLTNILSESSHPKLLAFAEEASKICLNAEGCEVVDVVAQLPKALLQADGPDGGVSIRLEVRRPAEGQRQTSCSLSMKVRLHCIIGVNAHERNAKQPIILTLTSKSDTLCEVTDFQGWFRELFEVRLPKASRVSGLLTRITRALSARPIIPWRP